ncbi:MAG: AI-2E family transporter [Ruminococcaceae bacterium]|nr:AI-2E family transporter [Oscillospiraceae bacterium]
MTGRKAALLINIAYFGVIALGVFLALRYLLPVTLPFLIAFGLSAVLQRPINLLSSRLERLPRKVIALFVLVIFYAFFALAFALIFRALALQVLEFLSTLPSTLSELAGGILEQGEKWLEKLPPWLQSIVGSDNADDVLLSAVDALSAPLMELLSAAGTAAMRLPSFLFVVMITVISSFFITIDYAGARDLLVSLCPRRARASLSRARHRATQTVLHLLKTYGRLMLITFAELCVGFWILNLLGAGISYVVPLSLIITLVDILPVLGVGTVLIPWAIASLISGNSRLCIMLLALMAVMSIARNILESRLVGGRFGLHPALTLLALYVGGKWFGILGVFALPLILIVVIQLHRDDPHDSPASESLPAQ